MLSRTIWRLFLWVSSVPLMYTLPLVGSSRKFMQRTVVDLPEPEGPMMTSFSPSATSSDTSFKTCRSPKNLLTFSNRIIKFLPFIAFVAQAACAECGPGSLPGTVKK